MSHVPVDDIEQLVSDANSASKGDDKQNNNDYVSDKGKDRE